MFHEGAFSDRDPPESELEDGLGWRVSGSGSGGRRKTFLKTLSASPTRWTWHSLGPPLYAGLRALSPGGTGLRQRSCHSPAS